MHSVQLSVVAANLLALFLGIVGPVWDYYETRSLKAQHGGVARLRYYRQTILWLWVAAGVACWTEGFDNLMTLRGLGIRTAWLDQHRWSWYLLTGTVILFLVAQLLPVVQVIVKYRNRPFLELRQLESLRFFLPAAPVERGWFAALSITAGFSEELLFRGFLLRYLHTFPFHLNFVWTALAAALIFGAHHLYQGSRGFLGTTLTGLVFTAILLVTGSLWTGMIYHAAIDLSLLLYWRPKPEAAPGPHVSSTENPSAVSPPTSTMPS